MKLITIYLHIDPSYYGFRLIGAQYAKVIYSVLELNGEVLYNTVEGIEARPSLIQAINNWSEIISLAEEAALNNFQSEFVNP